MALHAIVTAGGLLPTELWPHAESKVKALLRMQEKSLLDYAVGAITASSIFKRIAVVGNDEVRRELPANAEFVEQGDSLVANIQAGFEHLGGAGNDYLVCSPDLPFINAQALEHFVAEATQHSDLAFAYVTREDFMAHFPQSPNKFERIEGMDLTLGSCVYASGPMLSSNIPLAHDFYRSRKSPFKLAILLGLPVALGYASGKLKIDALERRFERLTGGRVRALRVSHAGIAYDIDSLENYRHALQVLAAKSQDFPGHP